MANMQIRIDDSLKEQASSVAQGMGLDLSAAVRLFLTQMVLENGLPFRPRSDPFWGIKNQEHLAKVAEDIKHGRNCASHALIED